MALTLAELQAVTDEYIESTDNDIYFKGNVLLYKLLGGETGSRTIPGGLTIDCVLEYAESNVGSFGNTTKFQMTKKDIFNRAAFRWAGYYSSLTIDLDDQRKNSGEAAIIDLVAGKLRNAQKTIRNKMGSEIYGSAANTDSFLGLGDLFNTTTSTAYGGIKQDDMSVWSAAVDATVEAISFSVMQKIRRLASIDDNMEGKPNLYITTELLKDAFEAKLQTQARYSDAKMVDAGFDNILFGGMPVVCDNKQTAGYVDALNLNFLEIVTHKDYNFTKPVWRNPVDQDDLKTAAIKWSGNLICRNRKAHARHTALTA